MRPGSTQSPRPPCLEGIMSTQPRVMAVEDSTNRKLGFCAATYVTQESCPECAFRGRGCYAEHGLVGFLTRRLNRAHPLNPARIAMEEAMAITKLTGDRPLRLHVVGDARTKRAAEILAHAAKVYRRRRG